MTAGDTVTWEYVVNNTGNVPLINVIVTDDQGVTPVYQSGDDGDNILQPGEIWIYNVTGTAISEPYANNGTVNADYDGMTVTDTDPSNYLGEEAAAPEIDIEKSTNGEDADAPPGPTITAGDTVTWEYVVNNTGNVPLINVTVTDDQGVTPVYQSGDDGDNILQPGEIWIYNATGTAISGPYANNGTVNADYDGITVTDTDPSNYLGEEAAAPEIDIEKSTNGEDADAPPGPTITAGDTVTWEYVVNNTGNVPLINVTVTDDQGVTPVYQSGDDGDNILQPGEIWIYNATGTAISGPYANNGTVNADYDGITVTDTDPSNYLGEEAAAPEIDIEKSTNGEDADAPPGLSYVVGAPIEWTYVVTNTGDVTLTNIVVTDDQGVTVSCPTDTLDPGESITCTATGTAMVGQYANNGTATGYYDGMTATDTDPSHYFGIDAPGVGTPGYWKNHPEAWPVDEIEIGGIIYPRDDAIDYMMDPVKKDKTFTMFPALVAAKLNVLIGNEYDKCAEEAGIDFIAEADAWMEENPIGSKVKGNSKEWKEGEPLYEWLDWYNNGYCFWAPERY
ncbi:hypothetical protein [Methanosarcina sp. MTP4]|uniref:DUF7507 domain-containing protein n=1 Tax=Methanosarcina sp. MTP4 TaxID=1434100 RepID=UPI003510CB9D